MMKATVLLVLTVLVALFACPSVQLGKLLTDEIHANGGSGPVSFPAIDGDLVTIEEANLATVDVRDSDGVVLTPKSTVIRSGGSAALKGRFSTEVGTSATESLQVTSTGPVLVAGEKSLYMSSGSTKFINTGTGPTLIASGHDVRFRANTTDIKSVFGVVVTGSSTHTQAEQEIRVDADALHLNSVRETSIRSSSGDIQMTSANAASAVANAFDANSLVSTQVVSQGNIDITAASVVNGEGGSGLISSLLGTTVTSLRRAIEFGARTTLDVQSTSAINFNSQTGVIVNAPGDSGSHVDIVSGGDFVASAPNGISITGGPVNIVSATGTVEFDIEEVTFQISHLFQISSETLPNSVDLTSTDSLKLSSSSDLIFDLAEDVYIDAPGVIEVMAPATLLSAKKNILIHSAGAATTITGGNHTLIESRDELGGVFILPNKALVMTAGRNIDVAARDVDFVTANQPFNFQSSSDIIATSGGGSNVNVLGTTSITSTGAQAIAFNGDQVFLTGTTSNTHTSTGSIVVSSRGVTDVSSATALTITTGTANKGNIVTTSTRDIKISTTQDLDHISQDFSITAIDRLSFSGGDFTGKAGSLSITAAGRFNAISEKNSVTSNSKTGQSITATNSEILLSAHDDLSILGAKGVTLTGGSHRYEATSSAGVGINIQATATDFDIRSAKADIHYSADANLLATAVKDIRITGTERHIMIGRESAQFTSQQRMFFNSTVGDSSWSSDAGLSSNAINHDTTVSSRRHIRLRAHDNLNMHAKTTAHTTTTSTGDITVSGGGVGFEATTTTVTWTVPNNLHVKSDTGTTYFEGKDTKIQPTRAYSAKGSETIRLTSEFLADIKFKAGTIFDISSSNRIETSTPQLFFRAQKVLQLIGEKGVQMLGRKDDLSTISSGGVITIVATHGTNIMSEANAQVLATEGVRAFSDHVSAISSDSTQIIGEGIHVTAIGVENNITMNAGGATDISTQSGEIFLASAHHMNHTQEEYLHMRATDGTFIIKTPNTNVANMHFHTLSGVFDIEGHKKIGIEATKVDGKDNGLANMVFDMSGAIDIESNQGGVVLRSEGLLQEAILSTYPDEIDLPSIVLETTDGAGNIVLTSERSIAEISGKLGVTFVSNGTAVSRGELGVDVTAGRDLRLYTNDTYDADGARGLHLIAGSEVSPNDIDFSVQKRVTLGAHDGINLVSDGPVFGDGIAIDSFQGNIRFGTSNGKDINTDANQNMEFLVSEDFHAHANGDVDILSIAGANSFKAQSNINFETAGGPVRFEAASGDGGAVTLQARTGSISYLSGGDAFFSALTDIATQAGTGYSLAVDNGNANFAAETGLSVIEMLAGGSIHVESTDDGAGIELESANNVEISATGTVSINSVKTFTIGQVSRPEVRFNALGDASTPGYVINSDGDMVIRTELIVDIDATEDFDVDATREIAIVSAGPSELKSTDGNIKFAATRGTARVHANEIDFQGEDSFDARTTDLFLIESRGRAPEHRIEVSGHRVNMQGRDYKMQAVAIDADATDAINMRARFEGVFTTEVGSRGSISLAAADDLSAFVTNGPLDILTQNQKAPLTIETNGNNADMTIDAQQQDSPITFKAGNLLSAKGDNTVLRALEPTVTAIQIESLRDVNNNDGKSADVEIRASKDIIVSAETNVDVIGEHGVVIATHFIDGVGNGSPLAIESSRHIEFEARQNMTLHTSREDGGSIAISAFDDVAITTQTGDLFVHPDNEYLIHSLEDQTWSIAGNMLGAIESRMHINAAGRLRGFNEESLLIQTTGADAQLLFDSPLGSIDVDAQQDLLVRAGGVIGGLATADITIATDVGAAVQTLAGHVVVTANNAITIDSQRDEARFNAGRNINMESTGANGKFTLTAAGTESNAVFGARFTGTDVRVQSAGTSVVVEAHDGTHFVGNDIFFLAKGTGVAKQIEITSTAPRGDIVFESSGTAKMTATRNIVMTASVENTKIVGSGAVSLRSSKLMTFDGTSGRVALVTPESATNAQVRVHANGEVFMKTDRSVMIKSTGNEGSNVYLQSNNGVMLFKTTVAADNPTHKVAIDARAKTGDLVVSARGLRAAIVQGGASVFLHASGNIGMTATSSRDIPPGFQIDTGNILVDNEDHDIILGGGYMDVNAQGKFEVVSSRNDITGPGHDFVFNVANDATFSAEGDITITASRFGNLAIEGNSPQFSNVPLRDAGVLFNPVFNPATKDVTTDMSAQARFLIPFTDEVIFQGDACTIPRQLVYTTGTQFSPTPEQGRARLCVCDPYNGGVTPNANSLYQCGPFVDLDGSGNLAVA